MNLFEKITYFLNAQMSTPPAYGWYHIMCILIVIAFSVFLGIKMKNASNKQIKVFLLIMSITMIVLEIYKQINFSFHYNSGNPYWDYQWYAFPFQFCSTPMYVALIAGLLKKGKIQDCLFAFLGTFALFAGLVVMIYPGDVFIGTIGINIQTMVVHGGMVVMGVVMHTSGRCKTELITILKAVSVFAVLVLIAITLNLSYVKLGGTETFNMFFISPYFPCTLPVLSMFDGKVPYIVFVMIYIVGFTIAATIILGLALLIKLLIAKINKK